ncbi:MAG: C69 family dipeptidase [Tatlockia sp.]|nr:C69 family dipeptidase [Tatlockia sp.]
MALISWIIIGVLLINVSDPIFACTTLIVGKKATLDGKTIIARSSDAIDSRRAKNFKIYYKGRQKIYVGLPYWDLETDEKNDMAQVATNARGLSISATETIQSNAKVLALDPSSNSVGVTERNIPYLVMPSAKSAREAIDILGKAIEVRGLKWKKGFGVLFADQNEAWYLETLSGHQWVALKIPDDVYFVAANGPGQIQAYSPALYEYKLSNYMGKTPIEFAIENNIAKLTINREFDFRKTFADVDNPRNPRKNFVRLAYLQHYFNSNTQFFNINVINKGDFPSFLKPEKKISLLDVQKVFASHYHEFKDFDPYQHPNKDEKQRPYYYPIANLNTSNVHITTVGPPFLNDDNNLANLQYIALGMPTLSFYLPLYYGLSKIPKSLVAATNLADLENEKLFWQFRRLQVLVFLSDLKKNIPFNPFKRMKIIQKNYELLALEIEKDRLIMETNYLKNPSSLLIDRFTAKTTAKLSYLNRKLIDEFMKQLAIVAKYKLHEKQELAQWFTAKTREQECNYKPERCRNKPKVNT